MRGLFTSDFFVRFAGGFALGAVALMSMQPAAVRQNLAAAVGILQVAV